MKETWLYFWLYLAPSEDCNLYAQIQRGYGLAVFDSIRQQGTCRISLSSKTSQILPEQESYLISMGLRVSISIDNGWSATNPTWQIKNWTGKNNLQKTLWDFLLQAILLRKLVMPTHSIWRLSLGKHSVYAKSSQGIRSRLWSIVWHKRITAKTIQPMPIVAVSFNVSFRWLMKMWMIALC